MNKLMLFKITICMLFCFSCAHANETQTAVQHISVQDGVVNISDELSNVLDEWNGNLEENVSFLEFLQENRDMDRVVSDYMGYVKENSQSYINIIEFIIDHDKQIYDEWLLELEDNTAYPYPKNEKGLALYLLTQEVNTFKVWEHKVIQQELETLENFAAQNDENAHIEWKNSLFIPSDSFGLSEWVEMRNYGSHTSFWIQVFKCMMAGNTIEDCIDIVLSGGGNGNGGGDPDPCKCMVSITNNHITSNFVSSSDTSDSKKKWWSEQHFAAHYAEGYTKKKSFSSGDLEQNNQSAFRVRMDCMKNDQKCDGCSADLDIYALYGSKLQVHTKTWGFFGGKSEVSVKDHVELNVLGNRGTRKDIDKLIAINQTTESDFKVEKLIDFITSLVDIGANVVSGNSSVSTYAKLGDKTVKSFKGIIKRTGKKGSHSDHMYVEYDTIGNSQDYAVPMNSNRAYSVSLNTNGQITYDGKGNHKTNNSYYGSSAALAVSVNNFTCPANTTAPPKTGCWSHANTYRSPYKNTTTLQDNLNWFLQSALLTSSVNTSPNLGCVTL